MSRTGAQVVLTKENYVEEILNKGFDADDNDITNIVNACIKAGAGIEVSKLETKACSMTSGSYTGNAVVNRAIPHGLGEKPKLVLITSGGGHLFTIIDNHIAEIAITCATVDQDFAVTDMDATNFYVGNIASDFNSGNGNSVHQAWVALS